MTRSNLSFISCQTTITHFIWTCPFYRVLFVPLPFSLCMESTSYVISFRMVFFYLVTTGWISDIISLYVRVQ